MKTSASTYHSYSSSSSRYKLRHDPLHRSERHEEGLKSASIRGGAVTVGTQAARFALQTGSTVALARLLLPADFGLIAMVATITNFALMFSHLGLGTATVQREDLSPAQLTNLFWINSGFGVLVAIALSALAPVVAWFYNDPRLITVTIVLSGTFIFGGMTVQHAALLTRHMRFLALGIAQVSSMALGVSAGVVAAVLGAGYWSLVIMHTTIAVATAISLWIAMPWMPGLPRLKTPVGHLVGFGGHVTAFSVLNYFSRNTDNILIGRFLGPTPLGFYSKAYALLMLPIRQLRSPLMNVGLPAMSRLQHQPERYSSYYYRLVGILAFFSAPLILFLGAYSRPLIDLLLGPGWEEAAKVFAILSPAAAIQAVAGTNGMVLLSSGMGKQYLRVGFVMAVATVGSFAAGLPWGITGVAVAYTIVNIVTLPLLLKMAFTRTLVTMKGFFKAVLLPYIASAFAVAGSRAVGSLYTQFPSWAYLLASLVVAALLYLGLCLLAPGGKKLLTEVTASARILFTRKSRAAAE